MLIFIILLFFFLFFSFLYFFFFSFVFRYFNEPRQRLILIDEDYWSKEKCNYTISMKGTIRFISRPRPKFRKSSRKYPFLFFLVPRKWTSKIYQNASSTPYPLQCFIHIYIYNIYTAPYFCSWTSHTLYANTVDYLTNIREEKIRCSSISVNNLL